MEWIIPNYKATSSSTTKKDLFYEDYPWMKDLPELSPESFPYYEYNADNSWFLYHVLPEGWIPLGWCYNDKLLFKPRPKGIAIKYSYEDKEFWQHLSIDDFKED